MSSESDDDFQEEEEEAERKEIARRRWKFLAQALIRNGETFTTTGVEDLSAMERFSTFNLFTVDSIDIPDHEYADWMIYWTMIFGETFSINIRHPKRSFSALDLIGFNNTGNICIWPSEEVLAYFCLNNRQLFADKYVLELGGGMTCLAGLLVAKYTTAIKVDVTDGNSNAVENVQFILRRNIFFDNSRISCSVLQWSEYRDEELDEDEKYDVIISADCLFFDEERDDLVQTLWTLLNDNGIVFIMAPLRGYTFYEFYKKAKMVGFTCNVKYSYNNVVWHRHLQFKQSSYYEENTNYPVLLILTK